MSLFLCALAKWAQQFRCNEYQYQPHCYPFSLHRAPILACTILTLLEDIPGLLSAVHTCWEQVLAAYTTRTISFTCRSHDVAISVSVVVWKKKKIYLNIWRALFWCRWLGACYGISFLFFFFCTAVGQNCFQGRMIVLLVYIVNQTDDPCIFQLDGSNGQPKKYIQCT